VSVAVKKRPTKRQREQACTLATAERRRHDVIERTQTDQAARGATVERVATQRVIDRLLRQRRITERQYDAAQRLLRTWWRGKELAGTPKVMDIGAQRTAGGAQPDPEGLTQARAREEYDAAVCALTASQRHTVELVVIWDHGPRNRVGVLERGLDALVAHYRL